MSSHPNNSDTPSSSASSSSSSSDSLTPPVSSTGEKDVSSSSSSSTSSTFSFLNSPIHSAVRLSVAQFALIAFLGGSSLYAGYRFGRWRAQVSLTDYAAHLNAAAMRVRTTQRPMHMSATGELLRPTELIDNPVELALRKKVRIDVNVGKAFMDMKRAQQHAQQSSPAANLTSSSTTHDNSQASAAVLSSSLPTTSPSSAAAPSAGNVNSNGSGSLFSLGATGLPPNTKSRPFYVEPEAHSSLTPEVLQGFRDDFEFEQRQYNTSPQFRAKALRLVAVAFLLGSALSSASMALFIYVVCQRLDIHSSADLAPKLGSAVNSFTRESIHPFVIGGVSTIQNFFGKIWIDWKSLKGIKRKFEEKEEKNEQRELKEEDKQQIKKFVQAVVAGGFSEERKLQLDEDIENAITEKRRIHRQPNHSTLPHGAASPAPLTSRPTTNDDTNTKTRSKNDEQY